MKQLKKGRDMKTKTKCQSKPENKMNLFPNHKIHFPNKKNNNLKYIGMGLGESATPFT